MKDFRARVLASRRGQMLTWDLALEMLAPWRLGNSPAVLASLLAPKQPLHYWYPGSTLDANSQQVSVCFGVPPSQHLPKDTMVPQVVARQLGVSLSSSAWQLCGTPVF